MRHLPAGDLKIAKPFKAGPTMGKAKSRRDCRVRIAPTQFAGRFDIIVHLASRAGTSTEGVLDSSVPSGLVLCALDPGSELPGYCQVSLREIRAGNRAPDRHPPAFHGSVLADGRTVNRVDQCTPFFASGQLRVRRIFGSVAATRSQSTSDSPAIDSSQ